MSIYTLTLSQPSGRGLIAYLRDKVSNKIYRVDSGGFSEDDLASHSGAGRDPYRLRFLERAPGSYYLDIDVTEFPDSDFELVARELVDTVEYGNISVFNFTVVSGEVSDKVIRLEFTYAPARRVVSYIQSSSFDTYLNLSKSSFSDLEFLVAPEDIRADYRLSYSEAEPGKYKLELDGNLFDDGSYIVQTYELASGMEYEVGDKYLFRVQDSKRVTGVDFGTIGLNHNSGGRDNLQYVTRSGEPVEGASVRVYLASDYASLDSPNPVGATITDRSGRWESPILAVPGTTYTVVFSKTHQYGPDSTEVTV